MIFSSISWEENFEVLHAFPTLTQLYQLCQSELFNLGPKSNSISIVELFQYTDSKADICLIWPHHLLVVSE